MKTVNEIAEFLKHERRRHKVKLEDMAERTGLTPVTLRGLLNGKNDSRLSTVLAVARELGLELALVPATVAGSIQQREHSVAVESLVSKALKSQQYAAPSLAYRLSAREHARGMEATPEDPGESDAMPSGMRDETQ